MNENEENTRILYFIDHRRVSILINEKQHSSLH